MTILTWLAWIAIFLILVGFTVLARRILGRGASLRFLTRRHVDPHLWGYHLLGAGTLLALLPWVARGRPPDQLSAPVQAVMGVAVLWAALAVLISTLVLFRPAGGSAPSRLIPPPELPARRWPLLYRSFLGGGFAVLLALALVAL